MIFHNPSNRSNWIPLQSKTISVDLNIWQLLLPSKSFHSFKKSRCADKMQASVNSEASVLIFLFWSFFFLVDSSDALGAILVTCYQQLAKLTALTMAIEYSGKNDKVTMNFKGSLPSFAIKEILGIKLARHIILRRLKILNELLCKLIVLGKV